MTNESILDLSNQEVSIIERKAYLSNKNIKKVILPSSLERIEDWAFSKCTNLKSVEFKSDFKPGLFAKGVFDGCSSLSRIYFADSSEDLKILLAATTNRLYNEHLLRSDDVGEQSWFEKWDLFLLSVLDTDDSEGSMAVAVCGEEDTSYNGMVDGEMPGETDEFIKNAGKNKCFLCYERLIHNSFLTENTKNRLEEYIRERSFEKKQKYAWLSLKEDCLDDVEYYKIYLDIVKPESTIINQMILDLSSTQVQAKAFLISEASKNDAQDAFFDDLFI